MNLLELVESSNRVYIIGNGGSYANAVHIANDLLSIGIRAYTLDPATLTASANDFGYDTVFARWLDVVGEKGDLLIALSGSGRSKNILRAIEVAEKRLMTVYRVFGAERNMGMQEAEEYQLNLGHFLMLAIKGKK